MSNKAGQSDVFKETNNHSQGRSGSGTETKNGPAVGKVKQGNGKSPVKGS